MIDSKSNPGWDKVLQSLRERKDTGKLLIKNYKELGSIQIIGFSFKSSENKNIQGYMNTDQVRPFLTIRKTSQNSTEYNVEAKMIFFGNNFGHMIHRDALDTFEENLLISDSKKLNQLKVSILEGIKLMGFKNTKTNEETSKVSYLYAINDNCNNLEKHISTFPILWVITEKVIEAKIIFAVDSKPGVFIDFGDLKSNKIDNISKLFEIKEKLSTPNSVALKLRQYLDLNFQRNEFYYLKIAFRLINVANTFMNKWKSIYDITKNHFYFKTLVYPLFPINLNKMLPQLLTSEGIIYYTSVVFGLSEIYNSKMKNYPIEASVFKQLVKQIKERLGRPIVKFTLLEDETKIKKKKQVILNETEKDGEIYEIIQHLKYCVNIFNLQEAKTINGKISLEVIN